MGFERLTVIVEIEDGPFLDTSFKDEFAKTSDGANKRQLSRTLSWLMVVCLDIGARNGGTGLIVLLVAPTRASSKENSKVGGSSHAGMPSKFRSGISHPLLQVKFTDRTQVKLGAALMVVAGD